MVTPEIEAHVLRLFHAEKWPVNTIADQLDIHHSVVERVLEQDGLPRPARKVPVSIVEPYVPFIVQTLKKYPRLCASRLYEMVHERGYRGGPDHFRHVVARYRPRRPAEAYLRLKTLPGEQGQVDWGHFGKIRIGTAQRLLMAFVMVLSWSRKIFLRFFLDQKTESFLRGHVAAFRAFGGCPRVVLYDNLKSAVLERRGDAIRFNPRLLAFAAHYRYEPRPVAVARGNEKARVERAIGYIRTSFFAARRFTDLDDLNRQARAWCEGRASDRPCPDKCTMTVREAFLQDRKHLLSLPDNPFCTDERVEVHVGRTPYVRFDGNDYSVPHTSVRKTLAVVASIAQVRVFDGAQLLCTHPRSYDRHQQIEDPAHIQELTAEKRKARRHRGMDRLYQAAPSTEALLLAAAQRGGNLGSITSRLLRLLEAYGASALERAVAEAVNSDAPHLAAVRQLLEQHRLAEGKPPPLPAPLPDDPRIRNLHVKPHDLDTYDALRQEHTDDDTDKDTNDG
jgi:transposase